ncbi:cytochrome P450 [Solimonas flava]|uniref:cytochrome P450 n=1 Tax=Solimonas flava TaxID=415849 RepID=UPI0004024C5B|nr:cytochrome P450 [Solimonas flava]
MNTSTQSGRAEIDGRIFNPFSRDFIRNPDPVWQMLLRDHPIAWHKDLQMWFVNSHALCERMLKDNRFTPNYRVWEHAPAPKPDTEKNDFDLMTDHSLFMVTPAEHLRLRKLTLPAFGRPVMHKIDATIRSLIVEAFDAIGSAEAFDVYTCLSTKLPTRAVARMVGVPEKDDAIFHKFSNSCVLATRINLPPRQRDQAIQDSLEGFAYFKQEIARRRALPHPGEDFLGSLISAKDGDDSLSDWDIIAVISALITAGSDTATDLYSYLIYALLRHPDQYELLKKKPELMENAILEMLRWSAFGKLPFFRFAAEDIEFDGQPIRKGQAICVNLTAAWHDPAKWVQPNEVQITRNLDGHLIFGAGAHFCIGTYLARTQAAITLQEFMRRFPNATLSNGDGDVEYDYQHHNARRIVRLNVQTGLQALRKAS